MRESEKAKILILDQSLRSREALREILTQDGYEVETAEAVQEGLELIGAHQFDVLVTDMPLSSMGRSGWLHSGPPEAVDLPVVAIVGTQDRGNEPDPLPDQVKVVLSTPVRKGELLAAVREALCIGPEHSLFS
ncbi:MAG: two-component system response regulator [Nitrospinota bacterium]